MVAGLRPQVFADKLVERAAELIDREGWELLITMADGLAVNGGYRYAGWSGQIFGGAEYTLPRRWTPRRPRVTLLIESKLDMGSLDLDPLTRVHTRVARLHLLGGIALYF